jgi:hypothetical protein
MNNRLWSLRRCRLLPIGGVPLLYLQKHVPHAVTPANVPLIYQVSKMHNRDDGLVPAIFIFGLVVVLGGVLVVSRSIGASFSSVLATATGLFIIGSVLGVAWYFYKKFGLSFFAAFFAFGWPATWPVLTSIANGGNDPDSSFRPWHEDSFINSAWMTWGVEFIFVALLVLAVIHQYRRHRYYW